MKCWQGQWHLAISGWGKNKNYFQRVSVKARKISNQASILNFSSKDSERKLVFITWTGNTDFASRERNWVAENWGGGRVFTKHFFISLTFYRCIFFKKGSVANQVLLLLAEENVLKADMCSLFENRGCSDFFSIVHTNFWIKKYVNKIC